MRPGEGPQGFWLTDPTHGGLPVAQHAGCRGRGQYGPRFSFSPVSCSLVSIALVCFVAGLKLLWDHSRGEPLPYRAAAGLALVSLGLAQARLTERLIRSYARRADHHFPWRPLVAWLVVGLVTCYGLGLVLGPDPSVCYVVAAALAGWYTLGLLPLVLPKLAERIHRSTLSRRVSRLEWAVVLLACALALSKGACERSTGCRASD